MCQAAWLCDLLPGQRAVIARVPSGALRQRLIDMGFLENTVIECVAISPPGDPAAYLVRGALVALRRQDSCRVPIVKWQAE